MSFSIYLWKPNKVGFDEQDIRRYIGIENNLG
jgi:hypothetical protein